MRHGETRCFGGAGVSCWRCEDGQAKKERMQACIMKGEQTCQVSCIRIRLFLQRPATIPTSCPLLECKTVAQT